MSADPSISKDLLDHVSVSVMRHHPANSDGMDVLVGVLIIGDIEAKSVGAKGRSALACGQSQKAAGA